MLRLKFLPAFGRCFLALLLGCLLPAWIPAAGAQLAFEDVSSTSNINHTGVSWSVAWGDVNADGYQDILVVNHGTVGGAPPSLYLNQGNGTFVDVYQDWFPFLKRDFHGSAWADFDNDGDQDLFISSGGSKGFAVRENIARETDANVLWSQDDTGFVDQAEALGLVEPLGRGRAPFWWDVNKDGLLDIFLTKASVTDDESLVYLQASGGKFRRCDHTFSSGVSEKNFSAITGAKLFESDTQHVIAKTPGLRFKLFQFVEPCGFIPVNAEAFSAIAVTEFAFADLVGRLRPQLLTVFAGRYDYVSLPRPNRLVIQYVTGESRLRQHTFSTSGRLRRVSILPADPAAWSNDKVYIGADGIHPDRRPFALGPQVKDHQGLASLDGVEEGVAIGYLADRSEWGITVKTRKGSRNLSIEIGSKGQIENIRPAEGVLDIEQGLGQDQIFDILPDGLRAVSQTFGWTEDTGCGTLVTADFDNDGDLDVYLGCQAETTNLPNRLFENVDGKFLRRVSGSGADGSQNGVTDSVTAGDYDNDGFLDLFITNGEGRLHVDNGPHQLLRNLGNDNHWVRFDLVGTRSPRDAYGARVFMTSGGKTQMRGFTGGFHFGSQNDSRVHFGLGTDRKIEDVIVQWPIGSVERFTDLSVDQDHDLVEGAGRSLDQGVLVTSRDKVKAGEAVTLIALAGQALDQGSLEWRLDGQVILENCIACAYTFSNVQNAIVSVAGQFANGQPFSIEKSVAVH